jgi:beta-phosphoglucomutase-like phosphatase (HAD superfamily)
MSVKGVIFDFNGTLLWDTQLHNIAWDNFLNEHGFSLSDEDKRRRIHGRLNSEILQDLFENKLTKKQIELFTLEKELGYQKLCKALDYFALADGVVELFEKLQVLGIPFVIATASGLENVEFYIRELKLNRWFRTEHIIYNDGTIRGKPFPDLFLRALDILGIEGKDSIIFEDSIAGIQAAEAADAGKVIIVNSNNSDYSAWVYKYPVIKHYNDVYIENF